MTTHAVRRGRRLGLATLGLLVALGPALACAEPAAGPRTAQRVYEVKPGDTLTSLAKRYGVSVATLVKLNKLPSGNVQLKTGQHLVIPGVEAEGVHLDLLQQGVGSVRERAAWRPTGWPFTRRARCSWLRGCPSTTACGPSR